MTPSSECFEIVKEFEGFNDEAYLCPAGVWTIGYGTTRYPDGKRVGPKDTCTREQAEAWLAHEVGGAAKDVLKLVRAPLTQEHFDALVSFVYNLGATNFSHSTLLRKLNAGDYRGAADEFPKWVNGGGRRLPGLVRRRNAERTLFMKGKP